jgi:hypothetical protein
LLLAQAGPVQIGSTERLAAVPVGKCCYGLMTRVIAGTAAVGDVPYRLRGYLIWVNATSAAQ